MIAFKLGAEAIGLDVWGPPENLSAVTLEGKPVMHGKNLYSSNGGQVLSGIYEVTKGRFKVIYPFHEHATVLDGEVTISDEAGNSVTYGPGDSWFCHQGEVVTWDVKDHLRKTFFVVTVDRFVTVAAQPSEPSRYQIAG
ncbi:MULTISPECIES: cupin domain-containing protein [Phyllobacteriaceae]|jgi:uncharacterized cupin superfamily protein|nr:MULTISPECIES: cupin domain-containing protein [Mesorhizobium]MBN9237740.1 DUF861 domain-containing protein [Mesorhizobium sp.]MDQ0327690.1 putative cupin superfamily protein [Mesorhizobium sp. YL-MeA3-2017]